MLNAKRSQRQRPKSAETAERGMAPKNSCGGEDGAQKTKTGKHWRTYVLRVIHVIYLHTNAQKYKFTQIVTDKL